MEKLVDNKNFCMFSSVLAKEIGINEAIFIHKLTFFLNPKHNKNLINGEFWVYNSYEEWNKIFPWLSECTIKRTFLNLEQIGFIKSFIQKTGSKGDKKWYAIINSAGQNDQRAQVKTTSGRRSK